VGVQDAVGLLWNHIERPVIATGGLPAHQNKVTKLIINFYPQD
jgi:hypothetical protein